MLAAEEGGYRVAEADLRQTPPEPAAFPDLVASFFTLSGAGFVQPTRNSFIERCEAAARPTPQQRSFAQ
jgi:hypothetical protein